MESNNKPVQNEEQNNMSNDEKIDALKKLILTLPKPDNSKNNINH